MGRYLPGHKDGGPLRTIVNVTEALGDEYEFYIACLDRDHGDTAPYPNIVYNDWNAVGKAKVRYIVGGFTCALIKELASQVDLVYLCGFYDDYGYKTLWLNRFNKLGGKPVAVASMGTFSRGALSQKSLKKKVFIGFCKVLGLFKKIKWSVTSSIELDEVKRIIGKKAECVIAEDLPRNNVPGRNQDEDHQQAFSVAFLSRICAHKNLDFAIRALSQMKTPVMFNIYAPIQEQEYWDECQKMLATVRYKWEYHGDIPSEQVQEKFAKNTAFIFPSKGENYGHVVFEALSVGCIPIVSNHTPWRILNDEKSGYMLPLDEELFASTLDEIAAMRKENRDRLSNNAVLLARKKLEESFVNTGYREIFG